MVDTVSPETRSRMMASIKAKGTKPEMRVRRLLHALGYRYRLHRGDLPGRPDLAFPSRRKVIFVNGCFWHHHPDCKLAYVPATNRDFWLTKFRDNQARDSRNLSSLAEAGWESATVWECELKKDTGAVVSQLVAFLGVDPKTERWQNSQG